MHDGRDRLRRTLGQRRERDIRVRGEAGHDCGREDARPFRRSSGKIGTMMAPGRPTKIAFAYMRDMDVRGAAVRL
jgi:hypothetical protein